MFCVASFVQHQWQVTSHIAYPPTRHGQRHGQGHRKWQPHTTYHIQHVTTKHKDITYHITKQQQHAQQQLFLQQQQQQLLLQHHQLQRQAIDSPYITSGDESSQAQKSAIANITLAGEMNEFDSKNISAMDARLAISPENWMDELNVFASTGQANQIQPGDSKEDGKLVSLICNEISNSFRIHCHVF